MSVKPRIRFNRPVEIVVDFLPRQKNAGFIRLGYSNAKMRFQSFFMLITVQPFCFASL